MLGFTSFYPTYKLERAYLFHRKWPDNMARNYPFLIKTLGVWLLFLVVVYLGQGNKGVSFVLFLTFVAVLSMILHILYFELSFLLREKRYRPKIYESVILGLLIGIGIVIKNGRGLHGESGFGFIMFSPLVVIFFVIAGFPIAILYIRRNISLFKKRTNVE
jgi:uncharacterized membrane-anchored protein